MDFAAINGPDATNDYFVVFAIFLHYKNIVARLNSSPAAKHPLEPRLPNYILLSRPAS
jgi:hypothetical protein